MLIPRGGHFNPEVFCGSLAFYIEPFKAACEPRFPFLPDGFGEAELISSSRGLSALQKSQPVARDLRSAIDLTRTVLKMNGKLLACFEHCAKLRFVVRCQLRACGAALKYAVKSA